MKGAHKGRGLRVALALLAIGLLATALSASGGSARAASSDSACLAGTSARQGHFGGVIPAAPIGCMTASGVDSPVSSGSPPLIFHNGQVMGTTSTGPIVVTPIFWHPAGHPMDAGYEDIITRYLGDVAADSGKDTNVFSTLTEYYGTNGPINYQLRLGPRIEDTNPLPADGCILAHKDLTGIYPDGSGYDSCIDDAQVNAEIASVVQARSLPINLAHIYVLYIPKHVETCFLPGPTSSQAHNSQACTINHERLKVGYCAYHTMDANRMVYANLSYPIYHSPLQTALFTCGSDAGIAFGRGHIQSPNGNPDADVEISPTSHELMEAITDPDVSTGWYDAVGNENGDECAYRFDTPLGGSLDTNTLYNQVINGDQYMTQTEFSNEDFANTGLGCLESEPSFP